MENKFLIPNLFSLQCSVSINAGVPTIGPWAQNEIHNENGILNSYTLVGFIFEVDSDYI